eukprot:TRINITY_DN5822_c0_g1_i1.p2 TRINITY_DN5822_c0_g1~~TRINITY_DN5822_c0_g1_i1.p2  ORF type:complete len:143 (+),score=21.46 TRINITY_DN5822_c0_g1_i1:174-602(+)
MVPPLVVPANTARMADAHCCWNANKCFSAHLHVCRACMWQCSTALRYHIIHRRACQQRLLLLLLPRAAAGPHTAQYSQPFAHQCSAAPSVRVRNDRHHQQLLPDVGGDRCGTRQRQQPLQLLPCMHCSIVPLCVRCRAPRHQ